MNFEKLKELSKAINDKGIRWALGASLVLYFNGIVNNPNDMDIMVSEEDEARLNALLSRRGTCKPKAYTEPYRTKGFYHYLVEDLEIDVMAGFAIAHEKGVYSYIFDGAAVDSYKDINGVKIPLTALEDWYVLYQLIPGRKKKVEIIEEALIEKGIKNPFLLERALTKELPDEIKANICRLMEKAKSARL